MESNSTLIIKVGGFLSSSSTITNMIIFNDAIYSILAIIGALLSLLGMLHEIWTDDKESKVISAIASLFRASILGAILTPMLFMAYIHMGGSLAKQIVGLAYKDGKLFITTIDHTLIKVNWQTKENEYIYDMRENGVYDSRGIEVIGQKLYILDGINSEGENQALAPQGHVLKNAIHIYDLI